MYFYSLLELKVSDKLYAYQVITRFEFEGFAWYFSENDSSPQKEEVVGICPKCPMLDQP